MPVGQLLDLARNKETVDCLVDSKSSEIVTAHAKRQRIVSKRCIKANLGSRRRCKIVM